MIIVGLWEILDLMAVFAAAAPACLARKPVVSPPVRNELPIVRTGLTLLTALKTFLITPLKNP